MCVYEGHGDKLSNQHYYMTGGRLVCYKLIQRGVETLDTYLKLILQVLELRYIAFLLLHTKSCGVHIRCMYIPRAAKKAFKYLLFSKQVSVPKSLTKMSPFVNPHIQIERPFVNVLCLPSLFNREKKEEKKQEKSERL